MEACGTCKKGMAAGAYRWGVQMGLCYSVSVGLRNPLISLVNSRVLKGYQRSAHLWPPGWKNRGLKSLRIGPVVGVWSRPPCRPITTGYSKVLPNS